ncbi:MAG: hypothetical protein A3C43_08935 [Candidatus Schekmanbacteria bacterium RIFCSPHIGHO2_02_FULL_38_11]|uniref:Peptidase M50 domain-containing protein n=1 Tax=Candidatus Schekmanbacteria bacterium RIFCSPLOWO2_12_FULL_38_15 TaxID=1817883 RepID=A0A1F7SLA5_9BACT|nr:MAG: hypothetical protein A2043_09065 [Candidatus Schekmanbacteria bacterium GWA2_38_9]OGL47949.1 MAG: hypothetical protein A3H37_07940 [Candidatus Schekmanbacteria bacterium RIFCSPLOWO2_02_FULL_38_14]OGL49034.1 MAG: hypothetical protein A3C43_08935 [Candidatus Schekmanbacteria bacterium RIFCSPHIGHO2_02_FULL_38_11]OGL54566.1 MAG: hypothetical protein A3G31_10450 [Candidatus Schekmanbacteria bacterium RIFCSPLOWO2_12_FULL_38_15]
MHKQIGELIISYIALILAISVHECSHAWTANRFGDPTAKNLGRMTLNPLAHIDLLGTVLIPLFIIISGSNILFGWAKPVPVNPYNLRNPKKGSLWVSFSGPLSNMVLAITAAVIYHLAGFIPGGVFFAQEWFFIFKPLILIVIFTIQLNIILAVFNLIPIFPLDGSGILMGILPAGKAILFEKTKPYGFLILLFLFYTGILGTILSPVYFTLINFLRVPIF